jgi:hypothetical protein
VARDRARLAGDAGAGPPLAPPEAGRPVVGFERVEVGSVGFDDFFALNGPDFPAALPVYFGLRVPPFVPNGAVPYVFVLSSMDLDVGERIVGVREFVSMAALVSESQPGPPPIGAPLLAVAPPVPPVSVFERPIVTPGWHPPGGGWFSFHLRIERARNVHFPRGPKDLASFVWRDTKSPALVYEAAEFPSPQLIPGYLGLNLYTPPVLRGTGEFVHHEIRNRWQSSEFGWINHVARVPERAILYGIVRQVADLRGGFAITSPPFTSTQVEFLSEGLVPEDDWLQGWTNVPSETLDIRVQWHRIAGSIIADKITRRTG